MVGGEVAGQQIILSTVNFDHPDYFTALICDPGCRPVTRSMIPPRWSRGGIATAVEYGRESDLTVGDG